MDSTPGEVDSKVTTEILNYISEELQQEWTDVARNLQVGGGELYRIKEDYKGNTKEAILQMFFSWQKKGGNSATLETLINALRGANRRDIADHVLEQLNVKPSGTSQEVDRSVCRLTDSTGKMKLQEPASLVNESKLDATEKHHQREGQNTENLEPDRKGQGTVTDGDQGASVLVTRTTSYVSSGYEVLIGGVIISPKQLVHIFDGRKLGRGVSLVCVDPKDPDKKSWKHIVNEIGSKYPIVMSRRAILFNRSFHVLFASGKTVFIVEFHSNTTSYDSVEKVTTLQVEVGPEESWISCIFGHQPSKDPCNEFLLTINSCSDLYVYTAPGRRTNTVETRDIVPQAEFHKVAYCAEKFAFITTSDNEVIVLTCNNQRKHCSYLQPPENLPKLTPIDIICTGLRWLVMYVHEDDQGKWWSVVAYKLGNINEKKICMEGACDPQVGEPVSITHSQRNGIVSFANGKTTTFKF